MNGLRLNRLSTDLFKFHDGNNTVQNQVIKVNSATDPSKDRVLNRAEIIAGCRLATVEYFGKQVNANPLTIEKYNSKLGDKYNSFQKGVWQDTVLFCAAMANKSIGKEPYTTIDEVRRDRSLYTNATFYNTLQSIAEEVITPLYPAVMDVATDRLITWDTVEFGSSKLIDIKSNDFFVFDDDSWGAVSSKPYQYLYKAQVALTPSPRTAKAKIKWCADVVGGEAGSYFAALALGARNKMYAMTLEKFKAAEANTKYMPTAFTQEYSQENWNSTLMLASAVNGVPRQQLMAVGTLQGLSNILPTVGSPAAAAGIQGQIGVEWVRNGFLANVAGVDLVEAGLALVPGTQNYNPQTLSLDDPDQQNIYVFAKNGYAPMAGAIAEGSPITITYSPEQTADMSIDLTMTIVCDIQPVFSSKVFKLTV